MSKANHITNHATERSKLRLTQVSPITPRVSGVNYAEHSEAKSRRAPARPITVSAANPITPRVSGVNYAEHSEAKLRRAPARPITLSASEAKLRRTSVSPVTVRASELIITPIVIYLISLI